MDSNWLEWRHYERLWDEYEGKGWELGPVRYVNLPVTFAEFGRYSIVFRYRDPETDESLFELREIHDGEVYRVLSVWGVPAPQQAEALLERCGVVLDEDPEEVPVEAPATSEGFWEDLLPPVAHAGELR